MRFKLNILWNDWHAEGRRKFCTIITVHSSLGDTVKLKYLWGNGERGIISERDPLLLYN
jgi:hypothetical protein